MLRRSPKSIRTDTRFPDPTLFRSRLTFTTDLSKGVKGAVSVFIAVGTPSRRGDVHADLSYVYAAAKEIAESLDGPTVIVTKSTVPVGTGDEVERIVREARPDLDIDRKSTRLNSSH